MNHTPNITVNAKDAMSALSATTQSLAVPHSGAGGSQGNGHGNSKQSMRTSSRRRTGNASPLLGSFQTSGQGAVS